MKMILMSLSAVLVLGGSSVVASEVKSGKVLLYTTSGNYVDSAVVGNLPDMVKFTHDGTQLITANEGEPISESIDPEGSISIITLNVNKTVKEVTTLGFENVQIGEGVRIQPGKTVAQDLEPEYVALSKDSKNAWVTLQENNAIAYVDIKNKKITAVKSLGEVEWKDTLVDIADDGEANVVQAPKNIFSLYMPDTIQSYKVKGKDYFVTANEGDDREYDWYEDYEKASKLSLSDELEASIGDSDSKKIRVLKDLGKNENGVYEKLYMAGTRSFTIRDGKGNIVFDSGSAFEEKLALAYADVFNTRVDDTDDQDDIAELIEDGIAYEMIGNKAYFWEGIDARSLKKGAEPEALSLATIGNKTFAYIGMEKQGGFMVYDITNPAKAKMVEYFNDIDYTALPSDSGDLAPEGSVTFKQNGQNYLAVANELSSTLSIYSLSTNGKMQKISSLKVGNFDKGASEIVDYDKEGKQLFVTNGEMKTVDFYDISNPDNPVKKDSINFSKYADSLQSISVKDGIVAIAVQ